MIPLIVFSYQTTCIWLILSNTCTQVLRSLQCQPQINYYQFRVDKIIRAKYESNRKKQLPNSYNCTQLRKGFTDRPHNYQSFFNQTWNLILQSEVLIYTLGPPIEGNTAYRDKVPIHLFIADVNVQDAWPWEIWRFYKAMILNNSRDTSNWVRKWLGTRL